MLAAGEKFKDITNRVSWIGILGLYEPRKFRSFLDEPFRAEWDHVGRLDQSTMTTDNVQTTEDCLHICLTKSKKCLAWTWETETHACHVSPWMIIGNAMENRFTGINTQRAMMLSSKCPQPKTAFDN
jgi:hypothetical protein